MIVRPAVMADVAAYVAMATAAQAWLRERGLGQYVPAAHAHQSAAILERVAAGTLYAVIDGDQPVGFFSLDSSSPWWPTDGVSALYLAGMVVDRGAKGRGVGDLIIDWCASVARRRGRGHLRLDCHAGNAWLCAYYERHSFRCRGQVEQHPGYEGRLYQLDVAPAA